MEKGKVRGRSGVGPGSPSVQYRDGLVVEKVVLVLVVVAAAGESGGRGLCKLGHSTEHHE